jgi:2-amino-4-hydroxy-6-hydroxymethyldihydropteridine diphosphokinase
VKTYNVFLGLGSNLGDRASYLSRAAVELKKIPDVKAIGSSSVYETDPVGNTEQGKFLNAVVEIETTIHPQELLGRVKNIEALLGRQHSERWGPREIDIDILVYDGLVHKSEELVVPHPMMTERKFVLVPLREIAPDLIHPENGMTVDELASACRDSSRVVRTSHRVAF